MSDQPKTLLEQGLAYAREMALLPPDQDFAAMLVYEEGWIRAGVIVKASDRWTVAADAGYSPTTGDLSGRILFTHKGRGVGPSRTQGLISTPAPIFVVLVPGTHAWLPGRNAGQWYAPDSSWFTWFRSQGFERLLPDRRQFVWSTELDGLVPGRRLATWAAAGENLYDYLVPPLAPERCIPPAETFLITHSHALQVVLHACAAGLKVDSLIDIAGPVREDMMAVAKLARRNIGDWQHVHSDRSDRMQWLGEIGDGVLGIVREHPLADVNYPVPKAGHSGVLNDQKYFGLLEPCLQRVRRRVQQRAAA